jgi:hypothetical protein
MKDRKSQMAQELSNLVRAFSLELPVAAANRALGVGDDEALSKAGWKAYDAAISLANEATNRVYEDGTIGSLAGRATETALRARLLANSLTSAFFRNLWPAIDLPTASEIAALRAEIAALHAELADAVEGVEIEEERKPSPYILTDDGVRLFTKARTPKVKNEDDDDAAA